LQKLMKAITGRLNNIRLKNKLIVSYLLVVVTPVLIVGIFLTTSYREFVLMQATEQVESNVERIKGQTYELMRKPIEISDNLLIDQSLSHVVNTQYKTTLQVVQAYWAYPDLKNYIQMYDEIENIRFYTTNETILDNWEFIKVTEPIASSEWYRSAMENDGILWGYIQDETKNNTRALSLIRRIDFPAYGTSGVLVISVDQGKLTSMMNQEAFDTMVLDEKGSIIASTDMNRAGRNISELDVDQELLQQPPGQYEFKFSGEPSKVFIDKQLPHLSLTGLTIISVFKIEDIAGGANRISTQGFSIIIVSLLIALLFIYLFSHLVTKRVLLLNRDLNKVSLGDLSVTSKVEGADEIGVLSKQFNHMVVSIRRLMDEVAQSNAQTSQLQLRQREIKLKMMASQINPHFLFNALESIRMKAHMNGQAEIAGVVRMLGKMIRRNLEVGSGKIELKKELELVSCYLEIQKFRYGNERLSFELVIDPDSENIHVPPLIIQPLVENAVVHGLENRAEGGFITLVTRLDDGLLHVEVTDNGSGISEHKLQEIYESLQDMEEEEEYRIGLRNVHQRLILIYGSQYGLCIESKQDEGTRISFAIPTGGQNNVQGTYR